MKLAFTLKLVCGRMLYYPQNNLAGTICRLANRKAMDRETVAQFRAEGFTIVVTDERTEPAVTTEYPPLGVSLG